MYVCLKCKEVKVFTCARLYLVTGYVYASCDKPEKKSHKNEISELTKTLTFNLLSGDTLTLKKWLATKIIDKS